MEKQNRYENHTISRLTAHTVWVTKYRYKVLEGEIQERIRELIIQICDSEDIKVLGGVVSKDHIHLHMEYPPKMSISDFIKKVKGRTSRIIQKEYPMLSKRYWGKHFWAIGYGVWSSGNITDDIIQDYLKHHETGKANNQNNIMLE
jgi:putative transposase